MISERIPPQQLDAFSHRMYAGLRVLIAQISEHGQELDSVVTGSSHFQRVLCFQFVGDRVVDLS